MSTVRLPVRAAAALVASLTVGGTTWALMGLADPPEAPRSGAFVQPSATVTDGPPAATTPTAPAVRPAPAAGDAVGRRSADLTSLPTRDHGGVPTRVVVPGAGIDLPVVPTGVDDAGAMQVPSGSSTAAWYRFGPGAGAEAGASVVAAHVSSRSEGRGPFARLAALRPGARVELTTAGGVVAYEVVSVDQVAKLSLDTASLFDRTGEHRLHLVTCGGRYDRATNSYEDNVVVVARVLG